MSIQHFDDNKLVALYQRGNEDALAVLVNRHKRKIYSCIYILIRDRELAEDFFQDTFIKVIQSIKSGNYYADGKFCAWAMRIAKNLIIDYFRKKKKMPMASNIVSEEGEEVDIFSILRVEDEGRTREEKAYIKRTMRALIEELPYEQRETLIMRAYYNMTFVEISKVTGVTINTALGRMRYALRNLKKMMEQQAIEIPI